MTYEPLKKPAHKNVITGVSRVSGRTWDKTQNFGEGRRADIAKQAAKNPAANRHGHLISVLLLAGLRKFFLLRAKEKLGLAGGDKNTAGNHFSGQHLEAKRENGKEASLPFLSLL